MSSSQISFFQQIKSIVGTGVNCIVSGGKVGEMALHFCNKFNILVVRLVLCSFFDWGRIQSARAICVG